jgi:hypothetical protein
MRSKSESFETRVEQIETKNGRDQAFLELWRSIDSNSVGKIMVGGLGEEISAKRLIGGYLFWTRSRGLSVDFEYEERIKYKIYL